MKITEFKGNPICIKSENSRLYTLFKITTIFISFEIISSIAEVLIGVVKVESGSMKRR
ncbi:Uncharacterised protein [uncultured archaeon]|nr:Uncharacterised protein [uncultured archaeon]